MSYAPNPTRVTIDESIILFKKWSDLKHSKLTTRTYIQYLKKFVEFCQIIRKNLIQEIQLEDCYDYGKWLRHQQYKESTQSFHMSALKQLIKICSAHKLISLDPASIPVPGYDSERHEALEIDDYIAMINVIKKQPQSFKNLRDEMIIRLSFFTGVRVSELCKLRVQDLQLADRYARIKTSKNKNKYRIAGCWDDETEVHLLRYLDERIKHAKTNHVIISLSRNQKNNGHQITTRSIERIFRNYRIIAKINKKITPHSARHGWAIEKMKQNMHPRYIQSGLGHVSLSTIQIYTEVYDQDIVKKLKDYSTQVDTTVSP